MKNIIATLNQLEQSLAQLNPESLSAIELDIALAKLRSLYERLLFVEVAEEQEDVQDSVIELIEDLIEEVENVPENEEPAVEEEAVEEEPVAEQEPEVEPEPQQEPEPKEEEPVAPKGKLAHKVVLSLYDDEEELPAAPATEEPTIEEPAAEVEPEVEPEPFVPTGLKIGLLVWSIINMAFGMFAFGIPALIMNIRSANKDVKKTKKSISYVKILNFTGSLALALVVFYSIYMSVKYATNL